MDGAGFVHIVARNLRIFDDFDDRGLSRLLVVFNRLSYTKVEAATRNGLLKLGEELRFENTVDQGIWFLWRADA